MLASTVRMVANSGGVVERSSGFEGVSVWLGPGRSITLGAMVQSSVASLTWAFGLPRGHFRRMMALQRLVEGRHKALLSGPHWQLMVLGVDPSHHGDGHGTALVEHGLDRADRQRLPVYVDTSAERNVGFYERFGFELVESLTVPEPNVPFWILIRPPR